MQTCARGLLCVMVFAVVIGGAIVIHGLSGSQEPPGKHPADAPIPGRRPAPGPLEAGELLTDPDGPMTLTSYSVAGDPSPGGQGLTSYVLDPRTGTFRATTYGEAAVSPDARLVAATEAEREVGGNWLVDRLVLADRRSGRERRVALRAALPGDVAYLQWSPNSQQILGTVFDRGTTITTMETKGFVIIDAGTLRVHFSPITPRSRQVEGEEGLPVSWDATADRVVFLTRSERGARLHWVPPRGGELGEGTLLPGASAAFGVRFSPDGRTMATACRDDRDDLGIRLWDFTGPPGQAPHEIRELPRLMLRAWADDDHLLAARRVSRNESTQPTKPENGEHWETVLVDLHGRHPQVIVRDTSWIPGPGFLGNYSPIPR